MAEAEKVMSPDLTINVHHVCDPKTMRTLWVILGVSLALNVILYRSLIWPILINKGRR